MIPAIILEANILAAMAKIDKEGVPPSRYSTKYEVRHAGHTYPPKLLISLALEDAIGRPLDSVLFSGGAETNGFLQRLGFTVAEKKRGILPTSTTQSSVRRPKSQALTATNQLAPQQLEHLCHKLLHSARLYEWSDLATNRALPQSTSGVYAWFFRFIPPGVPTQGCLVREGRTLLYVGISPESPNSAATLRGRLRQHFTGHAEGSTLRRTLGCLLEEELDTVLRRVGSHNRMTYGPNEIKLTHWMDKNATVAWVETDVPWQLEPYLIQNQNLPLNIKGNEGHSFYAELRRQRAQARQRARQLPVLRDR
jgi:hypothetical protein